ncbi:MAG: dipeptidase [Chloroflexi bacterium]|nr:dipeptidase [Chloroflexota bacterium]
MLCIDGHLDLGYNALFFNRDLKQTVHEVRAWEVGMDGKGRARNTVCFPEMRRGEIFICFATVNARRATGFKTPLDFSAEACTVAGQAQLLYYRLLEKQGVLRQLSTRSAIEAHQAEWTRSPEAAPLGYVLCIEGADCLLEPDDIFPWWDAGLRVLSLSHYGSSYYAHGTNTVGGLFPPARPLLANMEKLGVILDLTHTADGTFWEAIDVFHGRVIATHNCCRALVPHQRQFTDEMIRAIIARDGVIGVAFDDWMLHPGFDTMQPNPEIVTLNTVLDHVDRICQLAGNARHVAIGTDLDGGFGTEQCPSDVDTIADLQKFPARLRARAYSANDIEGFMRGNWLRLLHEALPAA